MTKTRRIYASIALFLAMISVSCAVNNQNPYEGFANETFEAWIEQHAPNAQKIEGGVYLEFRERSSTWETLPAPKLDSSWLKMSYTGRTLANNVFETRDSTTARLLGIWEYSTHFVDDYFLFTKSPKVCQGLEYALKLMRAGDSARIYIPANIAFYSNMGENVGYMNGATTYTGLPIIMDVALNEIINDPYEHEIRELNKWVAENWGLTEKDTLSRGIYYRILESKPEGDTITKDSTIHIYNSAHFLDGQLAATNNIDTARFYNYYDSNVSYTSLTITDIMFKDTTATYQVYPRVALKMRKGEKAEAVAISWRAGGIPGNISAKPEILPFESQHFYIWFPEEKKEEDKEEKKA